MAIGIGSLVRVKEPFDQQFPGVIPVTGQNAETGAWQIGEEVDFDESNLEEVIE